jgi:hypothetical protein
MNENARIGNGGPAFPRQETDDYAGDVGMSLRDWFAGQALKSVTEGDHVNGVGDPERHAALAYKYADAMLRERAK